MTKDAKSCKNTTQVYESRQKFMRAAKICQKFDQRCLKLPKGAKNAQNVQKVAKMTKICKKGQNMQNVPNFAQI